MMVVVLGMGSAGVWAQPYANTGAQTVCITGVAEPYGVINTSGSTYTWTVVGGASPTDWVLTATNTNLATVLWKTAGTYTIQVLETNAAGCPAPLPVTVLVTVSPTPATPTVTLVQTTCAVTTGTITVTTPTGVGMTYSIGGAYQASAIFNAVVPGPYTVTAKSSDGCLSLGTNVTIDVQPTPPAVATTILVQPTCAVATGTITVTAPLGATLEYSLDGGTFQSGVTFNAVAAGGHTITTRSTTDLTCTSIANVTIDVQPTPPAVATTILVQPTCAVATGTITVTAPLGATLEYSLDGGTFQSGVTFNAVAAGGHTITTRSTTDLTCTSVANVTINVQPALPSTSAIYHN